MKLNNKDKQQKIIGTDDIFVSSNNSSIGKDLESLLSKLDLDILDLKRNVKWLYKYGGVGGSGSGGGSGASSTKMLCVVSYTDINGTETQKKLSDGDFLNILEGSKITVTCTIISNKSLNEYSFSVNNFKTTIKATDINGAISTTPLGNTVYTVTLIGESTVSLTFTVFTKVTELSHLIVIPGGILILSNASIYSSQIENAVYLFVFTNNQPDNFNSSIDKISINNNELNPSLYSIEESINSLTNSKILTLKVPLKDLFTIYDIYYITVNYTFGEDSLILSDLFIYQSEEAFVYCWSDTVPVYNKITDTPLTVNNYNNIVNYRIYPGREDSLTLKYSLTINVDNQNSDLVIQGNTNNTYTIVNNISDNETHLVSINFKLGDTTYTYYVYLKKAADTVYFFEDDNGNKYYQAVSCDTENPNSEIITFPSKNPTIEDNPIIISQQTETSLNYVCLNFGIPTETDKVSDYVHAEPTSVGTLRLDALFSFGFKYLGANWDLPIIGIKYTNNSENKIIQLYKNSLTFNSDSLDICIPDDGQYHLILLYFKSDYKTSNESGKIDPNNTKLVVELYIDGVLEIKPFEINNFFIEKTCTSIVYYPGIWRFNHIGVATFNGKPLSYTTEFKYPCISKYIYDFDPIIPSNYYLTYCTRILGKKSNLQFDKTIYESLSTHLGTKRVHSLWINFFNYDDDSFLNKFVGVEPSVIASLAPSDMEIYCITPESTKLSQTESGFDTPPSNINLFIYNTFKSYGENDLVTKVSCNVLKWKTDSFKDIISNDSGDSILFYIKYQGSSTLLYSCKNFEIGINPILNQDGEELPVYFTPDVNLFPYMELSFNLKADVVDSSHSNNVVIGNFVNNYMTSPFNTTKKTYKSCLTGKPILLFIQNNVIADDQKTQLDNSYIFLGIYSLNLNRGSVHNLGYSTLVDSSGNEITTTDDNVNDERCCDTITKFHILQQTEKENFGNSFAVAEVQDNGILYDYSQFDSALLANQVLGDFYVSDNDRISREYSSVFTKPFKALAQIIYNYLIKGEIFHSVNLKSVFENSKDLENPSEFYYTNDNGELVHIPSDGIILTSNALNGVGSNIPYHEYENTTNGNKVALINNPMQQFHLVCNDQGIPIKKQKETYYYLESLNSLVYDSENPIAKIDVESAVKYFVTCMAFAMVDSVQKNLTIKCPDTKNNNIWYLGFYDMDTAFGISNSGGNTSFQAYSDYVDSDGLIIQDYSPVHSADLFDTPSSFLFLYAKYIDIITKGQMSNSEDNPIFPFQEWSNLRSKEGDFSSGTNFCKKYIDDYFGDINPLIWNLNYYYKYFSLSLNENTSDTESSKFNGTRRFARKEYLNQRFLYLDVLFGFRNEKTIGLSLNFYITNGSTTIPSNSDIKINNTMFPSFKKGVTGDISATINELPKTPIVLKISESISQFYITNSNGVANIKGKITSNTDCGFYGTGELTSVSECGQFLKNTTTDNTISNNKIKVINISSSPDASSKVNLSLDFKNMESVTDITIGNSSIMYYNTISIKNSSSSTFNVNSITLKNIKCSNISIENLNINNLVIQKCQCDSLLLSNLSIDSLTHTNNTIKSESWSVITYNKDLTISNTGCISLSITNSTLKSLAYTPSTVFTTLNLQSVNVGSNSSPMTQFVLNYTNKLNSLTVEKVKITTFKLNANFNQSLTNPLKGKVSLGFENTLVLLSIPGLDNITDLELGNVTSCTLLNNAFSCCKLLANIPTNITYTIQGNYIFKHCDCLNKDIMLSCILPSNTNYTGLFYNNAQIDADFVINWFNTHAANSLNLLFFKCKNIIMQYQISLTSLKVPSIYTKFETAFVNAVNKTTNMQTGITAMFQGANVNILTKKITDTLVNKGVTSINSLLGYNSETNNNIFASYQFVERLALDLFTSVQLTAYNYNDESGMNFLRMPICIFNDNGLILNTSMSDYFTDNCKVSTLLYFSPLMVIGTSSTFGKEISFDFENGFPSSIKSLLLFNYISTLNVSNMEKAFNKLSGCSLSKSSFHGTNCTSSDAYTNYTDLYSLLFKEDSDGNLIPKVNTDFNINDADGTYFSFPKKITAENCIKILDYYRTQTTDISWLFRGAVIYSCPNNTFLDSKLVGFNTMRYTFSYSNFYNKKGENIALDITNAFWNGEYEEDEVTKSSITINNMMHCFEKSHLKKMSSKLTLKDVLNMHSTFKNCVFTTDEAFKEAVPFLNPSGMVLLMPYLDKDFLILPDEFFKICNSQNCDLTNCFYYDSFNNGTNLTGYLPDADEDGINTLGLKNSFTLTNLLYGCNITYYKLKDINNAYRIFPSWYTKLIFTNKYNCYIPFTTLEPLSTVYLFEDADTIYGSYDILPNLPEISESGGNLWYYNRVTSDSYVSSHSPLKVAPNSSVFPNLSGISNYKNMIPMRLAYILRFTNTPTEVIEDFATKITEYKFSTSKPVILSLENSNKSNIFSGDEIDSTITSILFPN